MRSAINLRLHPSEYLVPALPTPVGRCSDGIDPAQAPIQYPTADAGIDLAELVSGRDHCGKPGIVAVVKELVEFFLDPGGHGFRAQIIQNQQG